MKRLRLVGMIAVLSLGQGAIAPHVFAKESTIQRNIDDKLSSHGYLTQNSHDFCGSGLITSPRNTNNTYDVSTYKIWVDYTRNPDPYNSNACGRVYQLKEDPNHVYYGIYFVCLVDGSGKSITTKLYQEQGGSLTEAYGTCVTDYSYLLPNQPAPPQPQPSPRDRRLTDAEAQQILSNLRERAKREGWTFELKDSEIFRISIELITGSDFPENFRPQLFDIIDLVERLIRDRRLPPNPQPAPPNPQPLPPGQLPTRFDAREWNVVPPIRDQKTCGSCWAFASLGSYETAYATLLGQPNTLDLSEQQLLDCNSENWSCGGGWVSQDTSAYRNLLDSGLVNEQTYPYQNQKGQCQRFPTANSGNLYRAGAFRFVAQGNPSSRQTIDSIKAAVWTYGSAWVTVYAGDEFDRAIQGYSGGVFNACNNKDLNHAVNIVGWDDAGGYWIMRNSWGQNWGENGYMRIVYGCNNIGEVVAVPQQLELLNCAGGSCQSVAPTAPPWLSQPAPAPQPPRPEPQPVPPNPQPQPQPDDGWGPRPDNNRPPNNTPAPGNYW